MAIELKRMGATKLERATGISKSTWSRWLRGDRKPSLDLARQAANSLGVSIEDLAKSLDECTGSSPEAA